MYTYMKMKGEVTQREIKDTLIEVLKDPTIIRQAAEEGAKEQNKLMTKAPLEVIKEGEKEFDRMGKCK